MAKKAKKGVSLRERLGLFLSNYKKLHQAAITHHDESMGRTAVSIIAGSKMLSEWDKTHYFGDTAIFAPNLLVAEDAWERIENGELSEMDKVDRARLIASFSKHEPVAIDALDYIERSDIGETEKLKHVGYIGRHTTHLAIAKRTLDMILRSQLKNEEKIPHIRELANRSKHSSVKKKASGWLESYRVIRA